MMIGNPKSTAQIAGHPPHPMLVPFPIAFLAVTLVCDLAFWWTGTISWATASLYLLGAALVMAGLAALMGFIDFIGEPKIRQLRAAQHHLAGNLVVVALALWNWWRRYDGGEAAVLPIGLLLSGLVVMLLLYTGWRGGEMVYRHRVAVSEPDRSAEARLDRQK